MNKELPTILFDVDGVLFNTKRNMMASWNDVNKKFNLQIKFEHYFSKIGIPFQKILQKLKIKKNNASIEKYYKKKSVFYIKLIKIYPNVKDTIDNLIKNGYKIGVVTSKDKKRTLQLLKNFNLNISSIVCPSKSLRGKPYPDQILKALKITKTANNNAIYIGDSKVDYVAARKSNIKFIFAKYGYGKIKNEKVSTIKNLLELKKYISINNFT
jgi:HAD superfamily hydrolase (TIGR01509 family)